MIDPCDLSTGLSRMIDQEDLAGLDQAQNHHGLGLKADLPVLCSSGLLLHFEVDALLFPGRRHTRPVMESYRLGAVVPARTPYLAAGRNLDHSHRRTRRSRNRLGTGQIAAAWEGHRRQGRAFAPRVQRRGAVVLGSHRCRPCRLAGRESVAAFSLSVVAHSAFRSIELRVVPYSNQCIRVDDVCERTG